TFVGGAMCRYRDGRWHEYSNRVARVWDARTGQELLTLKGHDQDVLSAQHSPDGRQIVTCSLDYTVRFWDAATGQQQALFRVPEGRAAPVRAVFSPDGKRLLVFASSERWRTGVSWTGVTPTAVDSPVRLEGLVEDAAAYQDVRANVQGSTFQGTSQLTLWD